MCASTHELASPVEATTCCGRSIERTQQNKVAPARTPGSMTLYLLSADSPKSFASPITASDHNTKPNSPAPRILVVDDETIIADTIVQILNRNGFIATAAYSGKEAIEVAYRDCPDLVLTDVLMPQVDGVEAAIRIRELCPDTRIVLFSGQAATLEILASARARGHDFELLAKPLHPTLLIKHLTRQQ